MRGEGGGEGEGGELRGDFLSPNSAYKMCHLLWPVGGSRGSPHFIGSARNPVSYTPSAFRIGVADVSRVCGAIASIFTVFPTIGAPFAAVPSLQWRCRCCCCCGCCCWWQCSCCCGSRRCDGPLSLLMLLLLLPLLLLLLPLLLPCCCCCCSSGCCYCGCCCCCCCCCLLLMLLMSLLLLLLFLVLLLLPLVSLMLLLLSLLAPTLT